MTDRYFWVLYKDYDGSETWDIAISVPDSPYFFVLACDEELDAPEADYNEREHIDDEGTGFVPHIVKIGPEILPPGPDWEIEHGS